MNLRNAVAIVAGGTGGIGSSVSRLLAREGANVVVVSRPANRNKELLSELTRLSPGSFSIQADLRTPEAWRRMVHEVCQRFHRIDLLINCIGILKPGRFDSLSTGEIEEVIATNFTAVLFGTRSVIPVMKNQRSGHIITVGSLGGIIPMPYEALYSATKFGVRGFSLSLNKELSGTGIQVSLISPGPVNTEMLAAEGNDVESAISFVNKPLNPAEVARAILRVIERPRIEVVLPRWTVRLGLLFNLAPSLFSLLYPALNILGRIRLFAYRAKNPQPILVSEEK